MRKMRVATTLETNRDREIRKLSNLLENAVAKNDTRSLKTLLTAERYEAEYLEGALIKATEASQQCGRCSAVARSRRIT